MRFLTSQVAPRAFTYNFFDEVEKMLNQQMVVNANITEEEDNYIVTMDVPGVSKQDINIDIRQNTLNISGTRKNFGEFNRTFALPQSVDVQKVEATLENGVLELTLPKAESAKPRRIEILDSKKSTQKLSSNKDQTTVEQ
jgi:HSP20 family molecular chaperone IbpA